MKRLRLPTFKCDNHVDYSNSYLVAGTRTQNYSVTYIPLRTIRVKVYDQSVYLQGATVVVNGKKLTSDANGYVTYRGGEAVSGTVEAFGYAGNTFSFGAITSDTTNTVEVYAAVEVKFIVKYGSKLISGATITSGADSGTTNLYGECVLMLGKGTHEYQVKHSNYFDFFGMVNVGTSSLTTNVALKINIESLKPVENGNIQMLLQGVTASINITSSTAEYVIEWGDGTTSSATGTGAISYEHTYINDDFYQVEVRSHNEVERCKSDSSSLIAYWSIGSSKVSNLSFGSCYGLLYVGLVFKNDVKRTIFNECFKNCYELRFIQIGLFDNCPEATIFNHCFAYCGNLTTIPIGLFDNCPEATIFNHCFAYCGNLTTIPIGLFDNCPEATEFNYCFVSCYKITSELPNLWIQYYGKIVSAPYCFNGCTKASNWLEVPKSWGGTAPEYVPPVAVSNYMMADYRAFEARIRNIELQQNMDKN